MTPGPESIVANDRFPAGRIVFSPPPDKLACLPRPARPARACRDCRRVQELEDELYRLAEWEHAKTLFSNGWMVGLPFDVGMAASEQLDGILAFNVTWLAAEEARIFGKAGE